MTCPLYNLQAQYKDPQREPRVSSIPQTYSSLSLALRALRKYSMMILSILATGILLVPTANAFWRLPCATPVLDCRIDPIVSPGRASSHVHTVHGSNGVHVSYTSTTKVNLTPCVSRWIQYFFRRPTKFPVLDMQSQGRQICLLDSPVGTWHACT
jgi:hypothetical protein